MSAFPRIEFACRVCGRSTGPVGLCIVHYAELARASLTAAPIVATGVSYTAPAGAGGAR